MKTLIRYILIFLSFFAVVLPIEQSVMASDAGGPHIPGPKGDIIEGWSVAGMHITNTIFSTWIFMGVLFVLVMAMYIAIMTDSLPRLRAFGLDIVNRIYMYATSLIGDAKIASNYMWLLG
jgi:hypothetical protein